MQVRQSMFVFVLALAGCMKPNPLVYTLGDAGEDATGSETGDGDGDPGDGDPGDGDPGDGDPGDGDPGDGDPGDGDPGDGDPGDGDGDDETGETGDGDGEPVGLDMPGGESCEPLEQPFEPACAECLALECCEATQACAGVDQCLCLANCRLSGGSPGTCKNTCGGVAPKDVDELDPLLACGKAACKQEC